MKIAHFTIAVVPLVLTQLELAFATPSEAQTVPGRTTYDFEVEKDLMVPMRDGTRLATDVYRPLGLEGPFPVVLMRLPYNKDSHLPPARFFASHGYAVVVQDARGKFKSEGEYRVYNGDVTDSWDTIEWSATQPWSTGKVGTYGCSYLGENQIIAAAQRHPAHMAALPKAAGGIVGTAGGRHTYFGTLEGGAFGLSAGYGWFPRVAGPSKGFALPPQVDIATQLESLPVLSMVERTGRPSWDWDQFFVRPLDDPYWTEIGYASDDDRFDVPALHVNSWYDLGVGETLLLFDLMRRNGESPRAQEGQYVIISPTGHCQSERAGEHTMVGDRDYGDARLDYFRIYLDWFDHWLKDADNGITDMPHVQVYVMGSNEWASFDQWPPPGTRFQRLHLRSDGGANDPDGGGRLTWDAPVGAETPDRYSYDPGDPVPSRGGSVCCTGNPDDQPGSFDQSDIEERDDVLVYTSEVLDEPLAIIGPIDAVLHVSSSARDTDFTVKLLDVDPQGRSWNIQEAILRARYREGFDRKVFMEEGEVYELRFNVHATAYEFQPGHRIRVQISSSNFPRFDRNLNTGGKNYDEIELRRPRTPHRPPRTKRS